MDNLTITGINYFGFFKAHVGLGEAARNNVTALRTCGIAVNTINFSTNPREVDDDVVNDTYNINIIQINPDNLQAFFLNKGIGFLTGKYNIAFWTWEQSIFPEDYHTFFAYFDEVWVPSTYCQDIISLVSPIPVICIPHIITATKATGVALPATLQTLLDTNGSRFLFMFFFDFNSQMYRKNTLALVQAFKQAFGSNSHVAGLLLKTSSSKYHPQDKQALDNAIAGDSNILQYEGILEREALTQLLNRCDCYVSLHHSEGFGLTLAEAMALGKPVIATGYSGNMEFMHTGNAYPVAFEMVTLQQQAGPFIQGASWAEPDINMAAGLMLNVQQNPQLASITGHKAANHIATQLSVDAIGAKMQQRLLLVSRLKQHKPTADLPQLQLQNSLLQEKLKQLKQLPAVKLKLKIREIKNKLTGKNKKYLWD
jgi:glycosyltransferase involved in cell wall biosynthesis